MNEYQKNKDRIRQEAIDYSNQVGDYEWIANDGISYGGIAILQDYFYKQGKRYGLLQEFRENGIC